MGVRKISFSFPQVMIYFLKTTTIKKRYCKHVYQRFPQHCGRDLLHCGKCGIIVEVQE